MRAWFYDTLKTYISLQTLEWRLEHLMELFTQTYTFALDGSEQQVVVSNKGWLNTRFFSGKKGKCTINILLVVLTKGKRTLYLSPLCPGSSNDPEILHTIYKKYFTKLTEKK